MALYDLESEDALRSDAYRAVSGTQSPLEPPDPAANGGTFARGRHRFDKELQ